jgi:hypothetical protein
MNKKVQLQDLGSKDYKETWDYQEVLFKEIVDIKIQNRQSNSQLPTPNFLLYVEHHSGEISPPNRCYGAQGAVSSVQIIKSLALPLKLLQGSSIPPRY